ncbi:alpha/beta fold hydrolase [Streptomyces sp. CB03238]|uniref:alpha/beta fold hydrolase n=1 Tax=Streptomyces sp. CB03238 TaxID=1907777 RepID=UPI001F4D5CDE|nr:alpha/beta fold hydrolase [Streptomyces sp. CB03238]
MLQTTQRLEWTAAGPDERLEYATLDVPLDYADPEGERISIAVSRLRAKDPVRRRGILLGVSGGPGGDGGQGRDLPGRLYDTPLADVYDLIGFDPRGTGASTQLSIEVTPTTAPFDSRPPDEVFAAMAADMYEREQGCRRAGGTVRPHINTRNTARDMDAIRAALGEDRLSFLGYAYGSYVGVVYGTMFPARLDRSVLDSCVHPGWTWRRQFLAQAAAVRANVDRWSEWTARRNGHFGLGTTAREVFAAVERVAARLEAQPHGTHARTSFDGTVGSLATDRSAWEKLGLLVGGLLAATAEGDAERAGTLLARHSTGGWGARANEQVRQSVLEAVTLETEWPADLETYYADMRECREKYPFGHGVLRAAPWVGAFRTFESPEPPTVPARDGYPVGLIVQADGDPLDDHEGGVAMAELLGHHLITVEDSGDHEVYVLSGSNPELEAYVEGYLVDGVLPPARVSVPGAHPVPAIPED